MADVPDQFGALQFPLAATPAGHVVADPLIEILPLFLKEYLNNEIGAAWDTAGVAPGLKVVDGVYSTAPQDVSTSFSSKRLPALFMWRASATDAWEAEDREIEHTRAVLLWVFPNVPGHRQDIRAPFINAVAKAIKIAVETGRTPGFIVAGDTDRYAATQGSQYGNFVGCQRLTVVSHKPVPVAITIIRAQTDRRPPPPMVYQGLEVILAVEERYDRGYDSTQTLFLTTDQTLTINGGPSSVEGRNTRT